MKLKGERKSRNYKQVLKQLLDFEIIKSRLCCTKLLAEFQVESHLTACLFTIFDSIMRMIRNTQFKFHRSIENVMLVLPPATTLQGIFLCHSASCPVKNLQGIQQNIGNVRKDQMNK